MSNAIRTKPCRHCRNLFTTQLNFIVYCSIACAFWSKVDVRGRNACWPWTAASDEHGYGHLRHDKRLYKAHRLAFALFHDVDPLAIDDFVLHECDNPPCCNGAHLKLGDQAVNIGDAVSRNRMNRDPKAWGEKHGMSKLTTRRVRAIRSSDLSGVALATKFNVSPSLITAVRKNRIWRHIQ